MFYVILGVIVFVVVVVLVIFLYLNRCSNKNKCLGTNNKCIDIPLGYMKQNNKCVLMPTTVTPVTTTETPVTTAPPVTTTGTPITNVEPTIAPMIITTTPIPVTLEPSADLLKIYNDIEFVNNLIDETIITKFEKIKLYISNSGLEKMVMFGFFLMFIPDKELPDPYYNDLAQKLVTNIKNFLTVVEDEKIRRNNNNINIELTSNNYKLEKLLFSLNVSEEKYIELMMKHDPNINKHIEDIDLLVEELNTIDINDEFIINTKQNLLNKFEKIKVLLQANNNSNKIEGFTIFENFAPF